MGGKVNSRKPEMKLVRGADKKSGGAIPTPGEVFRVARQAVQEIVAESLDISRRDTAEVARVLGEKIAMLYTEEVKTAVMLNSLVELLIEKGVLTKEEFKARVDKNSAETQKTYQQATAAMQAARQGGQDADGRKQEVGGKHFHRPRQGGGEEPGPGGPGLPPQEPEAV